MHYMMLLTSGADTEYCGDDIEYCLMVLTSGAGTKNCLMILTSGALIEYCLMVLTSGADIEYWLMVVTSGADIEYCLMVLTSGADIEHCLNGTDLWCWYWVLFELSNEGDKEHELCQTHDPLRGCADHVQHVSLKHVNKHTCQTL